MFGLKHTREGRTPVIAGNWKMNETTAEAVNLSQGISYAYDKEYDDVDVIVCPPFVDLKSVYNVFAFDKSPIMLGAQDVFWEEKGSYTGATSPLMLKEIHCAYCIVGHSERRAYFGDTDETVNRKAKALIAHGIHPIICCGESLEVRDAGEYLAFVAAQVRAALAGIEPDDLKESIIAYEPIWAIGTGRAAMPDQAQEVCAHIRAVVADVAGDDVAQEIRVLYGGSMKPANVEELIVLPDVDGGLIGGASLVAKDFATLIEAAHRLG